MQSAYSTPQSISKNKSIIRKQEVVEQERNRMCYIVVKMFILWGTFFRPHNFGPCETVAYSISQTLMKMNNINCNWSVSVKWIYFCVVKIHVLPTEKRVVQTTPSPCLWLANAYDNKNKNSTNTQYTQDYRKQTENIEKQTGTRESKNIESRFLVGGFLLLLLPTAWSHTKSERFLLVENWAWVLFVAVCRGAGMLISLCTCTGDCL